MGRNDLKGILLSVTKKDFTRLTIRHLEEMSRISKTSTFLIDMEGLSWGSLAYKPGYIFVIYPSTLQYCIYLISFTCSIRYFTEANSNF